jgi:tight adherence protein B
MDMMTIAMMAGVGLVIVVIMMVMDSGEGKALNKRIKRVKGGEEDILAEKTAEKLTLMKVTKDSHIPLMDQLIKTMLKNPDRLRQRLARTGKNITVSEYLLISAVSVVVCFILFSTLMGLKILPALLVGLGLGLFLPHTVIGMMGKKRMKNFIKFFPESIDAMVRSIKSGLPIAEAVNVVASEMPDPVGTEFGHIRDGVRMGRSLEDAMWDVAKRVDVPEYRYLIIALSIQRETGGNLSETLGNVAEVLRKRRQIKLKIKAMSSEAKASATILGALPFIVLAVLSVVNSQYVAMLFFDPRGHVLCGIALGMLGAGIMVMSNMINFEI